MVNRSFYIKKKKNNKVGGSVKKVQGIYLKDTNELTPEEKKKIALRSEKEGNVFKFILENGKAPVKAVKEMAKEDYSTEFDSIIREADNSPLPRRMRELEEAKKRIKNYLFDVSSIEDKEQGIAKLDDKEMKRFKGVIKKSFKEAQKEAFEKIKQKEREAKKEAKKHKFTFFNPEEKPKKLTVKLFSPFAKKRRRNIQEPVENKKNAEKKVYERAGIEEKIPKEAKEFAGYITKNPIMRREIANTFNLKSGNPHVVERFLESEEFKGKILRRYEKGLSKGTKRFLRDLQSLEEKKE